ncbi:MAG: plastocyanin/azurin family copper-binding protein [Arcobacteraceae bacterium]|nr:plastocyanin/azurin family copper-binding protein [Arcobacteraceae bacterium]
MKKILITTILASVLIAPLFAAEHTIDQLGRKFIPSAIKVKVGDTLRLKNSDPFAHNAYTDDMLNEFDTGMQSSGQDAIVTIKAKSNFDIYCAIHPEMQLKVTVE